MRNLNLTALFWFYKEPDICLNRLKLLKKFNPELKIYGLFGGEVNQAKIYQQKLGKYLDDFYVPPYTDPNWKWINGDLMILDWYQKRGKDLSWDSIVITQWDMLVFDSLVHQFPGLKKNQIFLSGLKELDGDTENRWDWTRPGELERENYLNFLEYVQKEYDFSGSPLCCLFILLIFPRLFFDKYASVKNPQIGMLEYKVPIYAKIFNIPFYKKDLGVWWHEKNQTLPLNAVPREIEESYIRQELAKPSGWRIFHPYYQIWK